MEQEVFVIKQLELLEIERTTEVEENKLLQECSSVKDLQKRGICVPKLRLVNSSTGLFGRSLNKFETFWPGNSLPSHTITSGDIVGIGVSSSDGKREILTSGVVTRANDTTITVALDKNSNSPELEYDVQYMIIKLANDVTYRRIKRALKVLHRQHNGRNLQLIDVLFNTRKPSSIDTALLNSITYFNNDLNDTQKDAVKFMLSQKEVAILHGPPGTGKTTTIVEAILQAVEQKLKVLACAPSNVAVDNLVEKLALHKVKMVRLGHPARFLTGIQQYSLDAVISRSSGSEVIDDLHKEMDKLRTKIGKTKGLMKKSLWGENKYLQKETKEREKAIMQEILRNADVVLATISSASEDGPIKHLPKDHFGVCFIDECSQALESACWIPLLMVPKCVLAGDHKQLPPTIMSKKAAEEGLAVTLMERLLKIHGDQIKMMLTMQYRMHKDIMQWPSEQLYDNKLEAHPLVAQHLLKDLPGMESNDDTMIPLLLIDTAGCCLDELEIEDEESKGNEGEADLVMIHVENLIKSGMNASDIAIITPYNLQVDLIKSRFSGRHPKLEIKSVDGFQGREKEAVVLSLVRSNDKGEVGFLSEDRRINVAITRARRHLAIICDSETVSHHNFLKSFVDYCSEKGEVRTALQYGENIGQQPSMRVKQASLKVSSKSDTKKNQMKNENVELKEDRLAVMNKYTKIINEFKKSKEALLTFPTSLNAFERRIIHEISEDTKLSHISSGEGLERCIKISKFPLSPEVTNESDEQDEQDSVIETEKHGISDSNNFQILEAEPIKNQFSQHKEKDVRNVHKAPTVKKKETPKQKNLKPQESSIESSVKAEEPLCVCNDLQILEAKESVSTKPITNHVPQHKVKDVQSVQKEPPLKKKREQPKLKTLKLKESGNGDDDFDSLIQQVMKADRTCSYDTCKKSVATLSQDCQFCRGRFCFSHFIPEGHGCGAAAKSHARSQIRKEGKIYPGSGKPQKKVDFIKENYLHDKLDKKIQELSKQRKAKAKS